MKLLKTVKVLGKTFSFYEKDDRIVICEILPAPFLPPPIEDRADAGAASQARKATRYRYRRIG